jgi:hypothetical protein
MGWVVNATPRPLHTRESDPVPIVKEAAWATRTDWPGAENLNPTGIRSSDPPARSKSLYRLSYPGPNDLFSSHFPTSTLHALSITSPMRVNLLLLIAYSIVLITWWTEQTMTLSPRKILQAPCISSCLSPNILFRTIFSVSGFHSSYSQRKIQQDATVYQHFIIPYLSEAQHVLGDTQPINRSLKLHGQPLVFHTWKVVGRCQAQYAWQRPATFSVSVARQPGPLKLVQRSLIFVVPASCHPSGA